MKFAENNRISHRQLYRQMILGLLAPFLLCIPGRNGMNGLSAVLGIVAPFQAVNLSTSSCKSQRDSINPYFPAIQAGNYLSSVLFSFFL